MKHNLWLLRTFCPLMQFEAGILGSVGAAFGISKTTTGSSFQEQTDEELKKRETGTTQATGSASTAKKTAADKAQTSTSQQREQTLADQVSTVSNLDAETQDLLKGLLSDLSGGSEELVAAQQERALTTDERLSGITDDIVANAQLKGDEQIGRVVQSLSRQAGSSQNSLVQQLGLQESTKVNREIADLAATLGIQVDQIATKNINDAVGSTATASAQLANVLKGADVTSSTQTSQTSSTDIVAALQEILRQTETGQQQTRTSEQSIVDSLATSSKTATGSGQGVSREKGFGISGSLGG